VRANCFPELGALLICPGMCGGRSFQGGKVLNVVQFS